MRRSRRRRCGVGAADGRACAAPSRNTERRTSGRSSSSAVGPWKRISPFSMKYALSATVRATFTDCSTRMIVVPWSRSAARSRAAGSTTAGARPSDSSSIISSRGLAMNAMPSVSICCWPPDRLPAGSSQPLAQDGEELEHLLGALRDLVVSVALEPAGEPEVLGDGERREHALAAGHLRHAAAGDLVGRRVGHVAAVEDDRAAARLDEAGDRLQQRRLPGAVGAEQGDDLALVDLEVDAEQHLHAVVVHVDAPHEQQLDLALAALVQRPRTAPPGRPHLVDVARANCVPAEARMSPPTTNTGAARSRPVRMP